MAKSSLENNALDLFRSAQRALENGLFEDVVSKANRVLAIEPNNIQAMELIAYGFGNQGDTKRALFFLSQVVKSPKASGSALYEYGSALIEENKLGDGIKCLERALILLPTSYEVLLDLGAAYAKQGHQTKAIEKLEQAIVLRNDAYEAYFNIGRLYDECNQYQKGIEYYQKTLEIKKDFFPALVNMAVDLILLKDWEGGLKYFKKAETLHPRAEFLFGEIMQAELYLHDWQGLERKIEELVSRIEVNEKVINPHIFLALIDSLDLQKKVAATFTKARVGLQPVSVVKPPPHQKIKIAYFSADFKAHPVALLTAQLFELHDRSRFELFAFSLRDPAQDDEMRSRIKGAFEHFYELEDRSDQEIAQLARDLQIDIAVDLGGYTDHARTGIFACRAAPIQVNYLGYPGTLGAAYMDYLVADPRLIPQSSQAFYSEKIAYLPDTYLPNDRTRQISARQFTRLELGLPEQGVIFCGFSNSYKINPKVFDSWASVLLKVPGSILWLRDDHPTAKANLIKEAAARGIAQERLVFAGRIQDQSEYLARYAVADIFLDTFPYNGHSTASEALWAGLPVLTLMGQSFAARVAASLLHAIDLPELITQTQAEYEDLAVDLATHPEKLEKIKQKLNANRLTKPLFDTPRFTRNLEAAYTQMYKRYLADLPPEHLYI